jgi:hypothetical protein
MTTYSVYTPGMVQPNSKLSMADAVPSVYATTYMKMELACDHKKSIPIDENTYKVMQF